MQRKIHGSPKKGVGCRFQRTIDHGKKGQYLYFGNQNSISSLSLHVCQIKIPNHLNT